LDGGRSGGAYLLLTRSTEGIERWLEGKRGGIRVLEKIGLYFMLGCNTNVRVTTGWRLLA